MLLCGLHCESKHTEVSLMVLTHIYEGKKVKGEGRRMFVQVCVTHGHQSVYPTADLGAQTTVVCIKARASCSRLRTFSCKNAHEACTGISHAVAPEMIRSEPDLESTTFQGTVNNR